MEFENNYIMRMIKEMVNVLFLLMFGKKYTPAKEEISNKYEIAGITLNQLLKMIDK